MKRDFDLLRVLLREIEDLPPGRIASAFKYDGIDKDTIAAHAALLFDAGLVKGKMRYPLKGPPQFQIAGLTWAGHDFIAVAKNDTIWEKARKSVLAPAAGAT